MKIIKRNGSEMVFDITKIIAAITKANEVVEEAERMTPVQIRRIAESVELQCDKLGRSPSVEEIRTFCAQQMDTVWDEVLRFENPHKYYVDLSQALWDEKHRLLSQHNH